jgi:hypothetical protein
VFTFLPVHTLNCVQTLKVLQQKMARDEMKRVQKRGYFSLLTGMLPIPGLEGYDPVNRNRAYKAFYLALALAAAPSFKAGFESAWELVYALAEAVCDAHVAARPNRQEITRVLTAHPTLLQLARDPLKVSRLVGKE